MEVVPDHVRILIYLFMIAYMLSVGLETTRGQIISILGDTRLAASALLANLVLVPIAGLILIRFIPVLPDTRTGLLLLALSPGGLFALNFARVSKGNVPLAVALLVLLSFLGTVVTPLLTHYFFGGGAHALFVLRLILLLFLLLVVPIFAGRLIAKFITPTLAQKLSKWIGTLSIGLFIVMTLLTSKAKSLDVKSIETGGIVFIVLLVIVSWVLGWLLGGKELRNKVVMAISTSMRNAGVCLAIVVHEFAGSRIIIPILAFSAISIPMNFLFALVSKIVLTKRMKSVGQSDDPVVSKS